MSNPSVYQTRHQDLCAVLRSVLTAAVQPGCGDQHGFGSVGYRAIATLYLILMNHPVDRRGRCRSCRRPGALLGLRRRRCLVHGEASVWLHQPVEFLRTHLARQLGLTTPPATPDRPSPPAESDPALPPPSGGTAGVGQPVTPTPPDPMVGRLTGPDLFAWMALRRVHRGHVAKLDNRYLDAGRPVPCFLPPALDDLVTAELVLLAEPDPMASGMSRVTLTEAGRARYAALCRREHHAALRMSA